MVVKEYQQSEHGKVRLAVSDDNATNEVDVDRKGAHLPRGT
jgi:hypothetical protein